MNMHDFNGLAEKFRKLSGEGMQRILRNIAEAVGESLLNFIIDEINHQGLIDSGTMVNSFTRGEDGNVWEWDVDRNVITLEVGSNLGDEEGNEDIWAYPRLVNEGYTIHKAHFVPGKWTKSGSFKYDRNAKGGFLAKPRTFIGRRYFDIAVEQLEGGLNKLIMERLEKELGRMLK